MAVLTGRDAVYAKALDMLGANLEKVALDLYGPNGRESINLGAAAKNLAGLLADFFAANGRAPAVIFNDGLPPSWAAQLATRGDAGKGTVYHYVPTNWGTSAIPVFAVRVLASGSFTYWSDVQQGDYGSSTVQQTARVFGAYNSRAPTSWATDPYAPVIPFDLVQMGAYQTWAVALLACTNPELLRCSDDGFMLTLDGCRAIEKSIVYWALRRNPAMMALDGFDADSWFGASPVLYGVPFSIIDALQKQFDAAQKNATLVNFVLEIAKIAAMFAAFYAGAAGLSGLVGGVFTLPNLSGALSMANQFGINTGSLSFATKALNLTAGNFGDILPGSSTTPGGTVPDVSLTDIGADGVDPSQVDFSNLMPDQTDFGPQIDIPADWWSAGLDPNDAALVDMSAIPNDIPYLSSDGSAYFDGSQVIGTDEIEQQAPDIATNPATQEAVKSEVAQRIQAQAAAKGQSISMADVLKNANGIVSLAVQYEKARTGQVSPTSSLLTANGTRVLTNANGTKTVTYPNGQTVTLPANYASPGVTPQLIAGVSNKTLAIGAGVALVALIFAQRRR